MRTGRLVDAKDLQRPPWALTERQAYSLLHRVGVRVSPRRLVALPERVEAFFAGELGGGEDSVQTVTGTSKPPEPATGRGA